MLLGTSSDWPPPADDLYKVGIYGWRKRCLYLFILILMLMVIINLTLTIWILQVLDFSVSGMGSMRVTSQGIFVDGRTEFLDGVYASQIRSREDSGLLLESARNITLSSRDKDQYVKSRIVLEKDRVEVMTDKFEVKSTNGNTLFSAQDKNVLIASRGKLSIIGSAGVWVNQTISSPLLRALPDRDLRVESLTDKVQILGAQGVELQSVTGSINISSLGEMRLQAKNGAISLDSPSLRFRQLPISRPDSNASSARSGVFQLCVCEGTGLLFLASPTLNCRATSDICVDRN